MLPWTFPWSILHSWWSWRRSQVCLKNKSLFINLNWFCNTFVEDVLASRLHHHASTNSVPWIWENSGCDGHNLVRKLIYNFILLVWCLLEQWPSSRRSSTFRPPWWTLISRCQSLRNMRHGRWWCPEPRRRIHGRGQAVHRIWEFWRGNPASRWIHERQPFKNI